MKTEGMAHGQYARLRRLAESIVPDNGFVSRKLREAGLTPGDLGSADRFRLLPTTTKQELVADQEQHPPYGANLTYPLERYVRLHQTSGTKGPPLRWLDTAESWEWMLGCWRKIYAIVGVEPGQRLFFPFSFGPFLGFWTAFEAAARLGCLCLASGGMTSGARLRMLLDNRAQVMLCTPTYAMHLAQVAAEQGLAIHGALQRIIVAGEPGGSIPSTRVKIEAAWGARLFDHSGMTEVGPMTIECQARPGGVHVLEEDYLVEIVDPSTLKPVPCGAVGEMLVTNLGRTGSPLLRYRTGDLVRADAAPCPCGLPYLRLEGGILGRTDDMISIRGNNFYPSALENVLRRFEEIVEYRVQVDSRAALAELVVEVEPMPGREAGLQERIVRAIRDELFFRAEVNLVPQGGLPRFEMKAKRVVVVRE